MKRLAILVLASFLFSTPAAFSDEPADIPAFYDRQVSSTQVKIYAKEIIGIGKVSLVLNGKELGWVRASQGANPKLRMIDGTPYFVRTGNLKKGANKVQVLVDGKLAWGAEIKR